MPDEISEVAVALDGREGVKIFELLVEAGLAASKSEARRLVQQGGVSIDQERVADPTALVEASERLVQVGKRRFARVRIA